MKTIIFNLVFLLAITISSFSQTYYIGMTLGWHYDVFHLAETYNSFFKSNLYVNFSNPMVNLNISKMWDNGLFVSSGLGYYQYMFCYKLRSTRPYAFYMKKCSLNTYNAITVPITVGYNCNIWKNRVFINLQSGFSFDLYSDRGGQIDEVSLAESYRWYFDFEEPVENSFNIFVSSKITLQYLTRFNMGIALFGGYHIGLLKVCKYAYGYVDWNNGKEILDTQILSNGSYWQFGIELGYKFGKKKEKSKTQ
jgi:hypothetical protein